jgi:orotidine-5'-phosphate decarboxylase
MNFSDKVAAAVQKNNSLVCVGLDSELSKIPIVDATKDLVCAYKPNSAFYEADGDRGMLELKQTCDYIHLTAPDVPVILDAKRGDIGNTNTGYIHYAFDYLRVDAITLHPYLGRESLEPFLALKDKGMIIMCRNSNPGAGELQDLEIGGKKMYKIVAEHIRDDWNANGNCAIVVGATFPEEMAEIRQFMGEDMLFLVPGVGAQGGDVEATVKAGCNSRGEGIIVNSARGIIFASEGENFADAARAETSKLREKINKYRKG